METEHKDRRRGCASGCAIGCFVVLILSGAASYGVYRFAKNQFTTFLTRYEDQGYSRVQKQFIKTESPVEEPTIFIGQTITITRGTQRGIAMLCQSAELHGRIKGNVHFVGQELTIYPDAALMYDLDVKAQTLNVYGTVEGKITGTYQTINKKPK